MEQQIHGHFREAQCMVVILEKHVPFIKIAKISINSPWGWLYELGRLTF
jgi:hypothetical protein